MHLYMLALLPFVCLYKQYSMCERSKNVCCSCAWKTYRFIKTEKQVHCVSMYMFTGKEKEEEKKTNKPKKNTHTKGILAVIKWNEGATEAKRSMPHWTLRNWKCEKVMLKCDVVTSQTTWFKEKKSNNFTTHSTKTIWFFGVLEITIWLFEFSVKFVIRTNKHLAKCSGHN